MTTAIPVLLVEDDALIAHTLAMGLRYEGFALTAAATISEAQYQLEQQRYDLILLDIGLPDGDGISLCAMLRQRYPHLAILMVSARTDESNVVASFAGGADDYLRKPFGLKELCVRMRRQLALRQAAPASEEICSFGQIEMDAGRRHASVAGLALALGKKEFDVLLLLVQAGGKAITRQQILAQFDEDSAIYDRTIDSHLSHLRRKLKDVAAQERIVAIYGVGYRLELA